MTSYDPLLGGRSYDLPQLDEQEAMLKQKWAEFQTAYQPKAKSPVWDEIDHIVDSMSESEKDYLAQDEEYQRSAAAVQEILQREIMRAMKPVVESTKDGNAALEAHLVLLRKVQKTAKEEAGQREALMNEYIMNHSDKTWAEFIAMKQGKTIKKKYDMNIYTEGAAMKKKVADAIEEWALEIVDGFTSGNPRMTMTGVYIKNGIRNYRKREEAKWDKMIDDAALFIADEKGEVDMDKVFKDAMQYLNDVEEMPISLGLFDGTIGKGTIKIHIPDNMLMRLLFGENSALILREADFKALKEMMV